MLFHSARRLGRNLVWMLLACSLGCAGKKGSYDQYLPSEQTARQALATALEAWKNGGPAGKIDTASPSIQAVDFQWQAGHKLSSYEILGEEPSDGPKVFSVRLRMQKPASEKVVRYFVVGKKPLWVYREDDYKKLSGM